MSSYDQLLFQLNAREHMDVTGTTSAQITDAIDALLLEVVTARYISNGVAGNRAVTLEILDAADVVVAQMAGDQVQVAGLTRFYTFNRAGPQDAVFVNGVLQRPLPLIRLQPNWKCRVRAVSGGDAGDAIRLLATVQRVRSSL